MSCLVSSSVSVHDVYIHLWHGVASSVLRLELPVISHLQRLWLNAAQQSSADRLVRTGVAASVLRTARRVCFCKVIVFHLPYF